MDASSVDHTERRILTTHEGREKNILKCVMSVDVVIIPVEKNTVYTEFMAGISVNANKYLKSLHNDVFGIDSTQGTFNLCTIRIALWIRDSFNHPTMPRSGMSLHSFPNFHPSMYRNEVVFWWVLCCPKTDWSVSRMRCSARN